MSQQKVVPNVQKSSRMSSLIFPGVLYALILMAEIIAVRFESVNGVSMQLGDVTVSSFTTSVIGSLFCMLLAAVIREEGAKSNTGFVAWGLFVFPIVPMIAFILLGLPFWLF